MKTFNQRFEDKLNSLNCSLYQPNNPTVMGGGPATGGIGALAGGIPFLLGLGRSTVNPNGYQSLSQALMNGWANPSSSNYGLPGPGASGGIPINASSPYGIPTNNNSSFSNILGNLFTSSVPFSTGIPNLPSRNSSVNSFTSNATTPPFTGDPTSSGGDSQLASILATLGIAIPGLSLPGSGGRPSPFPTPTLPGGPTNTNQSGTGGLSDLMKYLLPILAGGAGALNNRPGTTSSVPTFDPAVSPLRTQAIQGYTDLLKDPDLTGYQASGVSDINHQAGIAKQNSDEILASHGIVGGPAVAGAEANVENNRGNQITSFKNQIPLFKNSINSNNLAAVNSFLNSQRGTNVTTPGNILGGGVSGASSVLTLLAALGKL